MSIRVENLTFRYEGDNKDVLKNISFNISDGEWVSIVGHNGSGKSTLARLLIGIEEPTSGSIYINDELLNEESSYELRKHLGIIFQNPDNQFVASTIEDDIAFGLENSLVPQDEMKEKIISALLSVKMSEFINNSPDELSGGQKQRAAIAGIIAINPDTIIFDESTSMLDPEGRDDILNIIRELHNNGKTIIMITHNMDEASLSDRTIVLCDGEIIKDDTTFNVMNDLDTLKASRLEMPSELYLYYLLKNKEYKNEEVMNALWELASKK